jgi:hypothetical protein
MLFFPTLRKSWKRTNDLRDLQIAIVLAAKSSEAAGAAMDRYLDFCLADEALMPALQRHGLARDDLRARCEWLNAGGLGRWIKGHYMALSSIAYVEPLEYLALAERRGEDRTTICANLIDYWFGSLSKQKLVGMAGRGG